MELKERIGAFSQLGEDLRQALLDKNNKNGKIIGELINTEHLNNDWFTHENVRMSITAVADELTTENLSEWCSAYPELTEKRVPYNIGVVMAGNIPLVGFHDFLCVLISGNRILIKTSSKDNRLIVFIADMLYNIKPEFRDLIRITTDTLSGFDAVIATGSDNSSRYFEYYFGKYPHIIRKNRNSIAIINGNETEQDLKELGNDVFSYFGLGCRNVSKIYIPDGYDLNMLINKWEHYSGVINHSKYANNYDFNKAVYIVKREKFHDSGFILCREEKKIASPVSVLYHEYYSSLNSLEDELNQIKDKTQCIVGKNHVPFGMAQFPKLWDYADGTDTLEFLLKKNKAGIL